MNRVGRVGLFLAVVLASPIVAPPAVLAGESAFSGPHICKAAVSVLMGRSPSIMKSSSAGGEIIPEVIFNISYVRPDDGTTWKFKCKLEGSRVMWGSEPGRWRTHREDERIYFSTTGAGVSEKLTIELKHSDGSATRESFTVKDFR